VSYCETLNEQSESPLIDQLAIAITLSIKLYTNYLPLWEQYRCNLCKFIIFRAPKTLQNPTTAMSEYSYIFLSSGEGMIIIRFHLIRYHDNHLHIHSISPLYLHSYRIIKFGAGAPCLASSLPSSRADPSKTRSVMHPNAPPCSWPAGAVFCCFLSRTFGPWRLGGLPQVGI
jgi:hypothetical protein